PSKMSLPWCHHSGAVPAAAGPGSTHALPVQNHAWRLFHVLTTLVAATAVSSRPTPRPHRDGQDEQPGDRLAAAAEHQPQAEGDHGCAPVSVLTWEVSGDRK